MLASNKQYAAISQRLAQSFVQPLSFFQMTKRLSWPWIPCCGTGIDDLESVHHEAPTFKLHYLCILSDAPVVSCVLS